MSALEFVEQTPVAASDPNRADIACFVGFVGWRARRVPADIRDVLDAPAGRPPAAPLDREAALRRLLDLRRAHEIDPWLDAWLDERGWLHPRNGRLSAAELRDVPVPIDAWEAFDQLFAWDARPVSGRREQCTTYLGAAVRSFFAQGGRRCYVVRVGDPWRVTAARSEREAAVERLIPGFPGLVASSPVDQESWQGVGHLCGLSDVSFVSIPDLPDAVGTDPPPPRLEVLPLPPDEQFVECSPRVPPPSADGGARLFRAPRSDESGYLRWARAVARVADFLRRRRREVQILAAVPIPERGTRADADLPRFLRATFLQLDVAEADRGLASSFVQLTYPWLRTPGSANLPESIEPPDATLTGVLARNALTRGAYRSVAGLRLADVQGFHPALRRDHMLPAPLRPAGGARLEPSFADSVSVLGATPGGPRVLSDVTTSRSETYRPASVHRLVSVIVQAARHLGDDIVFEPSAERMWDRVREYLTALLVDLLRQGALRGSNAADAFHVRCDRGTMTQQDLDAGRVVASVQFSAAVPIERIVVVLAVQDGSPMSLVSVDEAREVAA